MTTDVVFDFFGTLAQYDPSRVVVGSRSAAFEIARGCGVALTRDAYDAAATASYARLERDARSTLREFHMRDWARAFSADVGWQEAGDETLDRFVDAFLHDWNALVWYAPHVLPVVQELSTRYRLGVLSNTHHPQLVPWHVRAMGIEPYMAQIVTSVDFGRCKPHPGIFRHALDRLGIEAGRAVYVGDDFQADFLGATRAGLRCILIDPERLHPELRVDRVYSLSQIGERL